MTVSDSASAVEPLRARSVVVGLNGLRGISCLGVLVLHVGGHYSPDTMGAYRVGLAGQTLMLFFALSGFLLYLPFVRSIAASRTAARLPDLRTYAVHRLLRIFPAYLVVLLVCNYILHVAYVQNAAVQQPGTDNGTGTITDFDMLLANLTLIHSYFPQYMQTGINTSWTLTLEYAFYVVVPVCGAVMLLLRRRTDWSPLRISLFAPVALFSMSLVGQTVSFMLQSGDSAIDPLLAQWGPNWLAVFHRSFFSLAGTFVFGMVAAVIYVAVDTKALSDRVAGLLRPLCLAIFFPAAAVSAVLTAAGAHFYFSTIAVAAGAVVMFVVAPQARGRSSRLARSLDVAPLAYLGKVSLSLYLWHFPVLILLGRLGVIGGDDLAGMLRNIALVTAVSLVAASLTYTLVEKPAITLANRYRRRRATYRTVVEPSAAPVAVATQ